MTSRTLTQADLEKLSQYAQNNDRYDYWSLLSGLGDSYSKLALDVVTGDSLFGYIANQYTASFAPTGSGLGNPDDTQVWWGVGVGLMDAILRRRCKIWNFSPRA